METPNLNRMSGMDCPEYLDTFSEYLDGRTDPGLTRAMENHRSDCSPCRRYSEALEAGARLLRDLPPMEVPSDFRPRLNHRIFHLEDGPAIARETLGTGATTVSVLAVATLLALAAWAPSVGLSPDTVELPPVVVAGPPAPSFTKAPQVPTFSRSLSLFSSRDFQDGIWGDPHRLLFQYSSLSERRRESTLVRTAIQ